jgi:hypothetical protein
MAPKDIKHLFTDKGQVLSAIVIHGARTFDDIKYVYDNISIYQWTDLHILLGERARVDLEEEQPIFKEKPWLWSNLTEFSEKHNLDILELIEQLVV